MSLTFSQFADGDKTKGGYFRIGFVTLQVPPEDILTSRVVNNDKFATLRGGAEMHVKSGQARWDVTVRWTALLGDDAGDQNYYQQWEDVQSILAIFKAAPFVEVESPHLRQIFAEKDPAMSSSRLAFALRQLRIDTHPDIVDALSCTLTMTLFNFYPYSKNFAYAGGRGEEVDAYQSDKFKQYIQIWKDDNLSYRPKAHNDPHASPWKEQVAGALTLTWRQYLPVQNNDAPDQSGIIAPPGNGAIEINGVYDSIIVREAASFGLDPSLVKAIMEQESGFQPQAVNPDNADFTANQVRQAILSAPDGGLAFLASNKLRPDLGLMQMNWRTVHGTDRRPGLDPSVRPIDLFDPNVCIRLGCKYISGLYQGGTTDQTIYAYNTGSPKSVFLGADAAGRGFTDSFVYRDAVLRNRNKWSMPVAAREPAVPVPVATSQPATDQQKQEEATARALIGDGWIFDHRVDGTSFFYQENNIVLADAEHSNAVNAFNLFPTQFSVLFVNNLAQIPLAGYQYPTYQHIGPASGVVSIGFTSAGQMAFDDDEPLHAGVTELTSMSHALEEQFRRLRTSFRRVSSIHRMQAVFVQNQVLNLLGIHGLMLNQVNTETIQDSADMLQVQLLASQYENVFEDIGPYRVNGIPSSYRQQLRSIVLDENSLNNLPTEEKTAISEVLLYRKERDNDNEAALVERIIQAGRSRNDILKAFSGLPAIALSDSEKQFLYTPSDPHSFADRYPGLQARIESLRASKADPTFADVIVLSQLLSDNAVDQAAADNSAILTSILQKTATKAGSSRRQYVRQMYDQGFEFFALTDRILFGQLEKIINSPKYLDRIKNAVPSDDPAAANLEHGAYRDLGLNVMSLAGKDFNPGYYFVNHNDDYRDRVHQNLKKTLDITQSTSQETNAAVNRDAIVLTDSTRIPGNTEAVMRATHIPGYNMAEAFPAFKLFFMEEDNLGFFQSFDNFYSFSSVTDIEIVRPKDKPMTAIIQLTNLCHLLSHKLFDDTMAGKHERRLDRFGRNLPVDDTGEVIDTPGGQIIQGGKTFGGEPYMLGPDLTEGFGKSRRRIPLKYFPLQTGTKIQIRMGYTNNPDDLTPVFTGEVTSIEGVDLMTITAQSYLLELATLSTDKIKHDGWIHLGSALHNAFSFLPGVHLERGPAYGGVTVFGDSADVGSVVENLLKNAGAKHFGHWQINALTPDSLVKGFTWTEMAGNLLSAAGATRIGSILQANYDRSGENIMVNHIVNYDGTIDNTRGKRDFFDQQGDAFLRPFSYYIDAKSTMSVWELIQDVARRYPEYTLLEKQYGSPYGAEATLVFAHPLDWYYSRWPLIGDSERVRAADKDDVLYRTWWTSSGKMLFEQAVRNVINNSGNALDVIDLDGLSNEAGRNSAGLASVLNEVLQHELNLFGIVLPDIGISIPTPAGSINISNDLLALPQKLLNSMIPSGQAAFRQAQRELDAVRKAYEGFVLQADPKSKDRLKPVRRYHFIDHQSIVHNGMVINDKIFNAVRIDDWGPYKANQNIPDQHSRMLDVTERINNPKQNVLDPGLQRPYAQSFLREEVGRMYRGEIILRGVPEIEPMDVLLIMDPSTGMVGPVEVDQVIHSFNQENGFITIVKPRAIVTVNEAASAGFIRALSNTFATTVAEIQDIRSANVFAKTGVGLAGAAAVASAAGAVVLFGTPPGWIILTLSAIALTVGVSWWVDKNRDLNPLLIMPVSRFGRPWIGGMQGFVVSDFVTSLGNQVEQFMADEIWPTIELYKLINGYNDDFLDQPLAQPLAPPK